MDFTFTAQQEELRRAVRDLGEKRSSSQQVRETMASGGHDADLWVVIGQQLGLAALPVSEAAGGVGASWVEVGVVLEELGACLAVVPLLSHLVAVSVIPERASVLADVAAGTKTAAVALGPGVNAAGGALLGRMDHLSYGATADVVVVVAADQESEALYLVDVAEGGVAVEPLIPIDQTRPQSNVVLDAAPAHRIGGQDAVDRARDIQRVAIALDSVGAARTALELTVAYLKTRVQFGRALGGFQALRHRAADCAVALEAATATARYASWVVDGNPAELAEVAPIAKALCTQTFHDLAAEMIQLHGGIGFTWEHDAHLYFKRATTNLLIGGDPAAQRSELATRVPLLSPR